MLPTEGGRCALCGVDGRWGITCPVDAGESNAQGHPHRADGEPSLGLHRGWVAGRPPV
jgi:hypothetical protein